MQMKIHITHIIKKCFINQFISFRKYLHLKTNCKVCSIFSTSFAELKLIYNFTSISSYWAYFNFTFQ